MSESWNKARSDALKEGFYEFLRYCSVNSKEKGKIVLGDHIYTAQKYLIDAIFDGLSEDIHDFKVLKSRQLGVSTLSRALTLFWIGVHPGLRGYMVFDTWPHADEARTELVEMLRNLPANFKFPTTGGPGGRDSRHMLRLDNDSQMMFAAAGTSQRKSSSVLGRGSGVNFYHRSELCSYENLEAMEAFQKSLAQDFPNRLYIDESTARGYNIWNEIWEEAKDNPHAKCIFLGWYLKDNQKIPRKDPDWERYGVYPPTVEEIAKMREVKDLYGWTITPEQLAWIRRDSDPAAKPEGDAPPDFTPSTLRLQENPWCERDSWQMTGSVFFDPASLSEMAYKHASRKFKTYSFASGIEFPEFKIYPAPNARSVELKIWEEPVEGAVYVISADPAFGHDENNDRSALHVMRCYADGMDQVAEYAWPLINTRQFGWVIAALMGYYAGDTADVYFIMEINGPGEAVFNELKSLKHQLAMNYLPEMKELKIQNIFRNVKNYIYGRSDAMGPGRSYMWKTNTQLKVAIFERLRDFTGNGMVWVRSQDTLEEMRSITREGDSIAAQGTKKDDRVFALAMAVRYWDERIRRGLISARRSRDSEAKKERVTMKDQVQMFHSHQIEQFFVQKVRNRQMEALAVSRGAWRGRR